MKVINNLKIEITQADVEEAITRMIQEYDSKIQVDSIDFTAKRSGSDKINVSVDAHYGTKEEELVVKQEEHIPELEEVKSFFDEEIAEETLEQSNPFLAS